MIIGKHVAFRRYMLLFCANKQSQKVRLRMPCLHEQTQGGLYDEQRERETPEAFRVCLFASLLLYLMSNSTE